MRKVIVLLIVLSIFITGCTTETTNNKKKDESKKVKDIVTDKTSQYQDNNNTPIAFYELKVNTLTKVNSITDNYQPLDDITLIQIYPSIEDNINLSDSFANSFYNTWNSFNPNNLLKIGFSLTYTVNNQEVYYPILSPNNTMDHWEYFMVYLYDDYINRGKGFYSHIENDEFNDNTLFTSIKLQCGAYCKDITKPISFTVFTYDSEDDFLDNKYRGNSFYTIQICLNGTC